MQDVKIYSLFLIIAYIIEYACSWYLQTDYNIPFIMITICAALWLVGEQFEKLEKKINNASSPV